MVSNILIKLAIPASLLGFRYLRSAIIMIIKDLKLSDNFSNKIYPQIANLFDITPSRIECAMRHAIEVSWTRCPKNVLDVYFKGIIKKSTIRKFILSIVNRVVLTSKKIIKMGVAYE